MYFKMSTLVILVVAFSALAGSVDAISTLITKMRIKRTTETLAVLQRTLEEYAEQNGNYPCPARPRLSPRNANFGISADCSSPTPPAGSNILRSTGAAAINNEIWMGMVPIRSLGLPDNMAVDAWGNRISYAVTRRAAIGPGAAAPSVDPAKYGDDLADPDAGSGKITIVDGAATSNIVTRQAMFVLVSHGKDGNGAVTEGIGLAPGATAPIPRACPPLLGPGRSRDAENCDGVGTPAGTMNGTFRRQIQLNLRQGNNYFDDWVVFSSRVPVQADLSQPTAELKCVTARVRSNGGGKPAAAPGIYNNAEPVDGSQGGNGIFVDAVRKYTASGPGLTPAIIGSSRDPGGVALQCINGYKLTGCYYANNWRMKYDPARPWTQWLDYNLGKIPDYEAFPAANEICSSDNEEGMTWWSPGGPGRVNNISGVRLLGFDSWGCGDGRAYPYSQWAPFGAWENISRCYGELTATCCKVEITP